MKPKPFATARAMFYVDCYRKTSPSKQLQINFYTFFSFFFSFISGKSFCLKLWYLLYMEGLRTQGAFRRGEQPAWERHGWVTRRKSKQLVTSCVYLWNKHTSQSGRDLKWKEIATFLHFFPVRVHVSRCGPMLLLVKTRDDAHSNQYCILTVFSASKQWTHEKIWIKNPI